jgi:hypothetical protein
MMNGYVHLEFYYPQEAIDNNMEGGNGQSQHVPEIQWSSDHACGFQRLSDRGKCQDQSSGHRMIPSSTAGTSAQFELFGAGNSSYTPTYIPIPPDPQIGPYPINVKVTVVLSWIEL